MNTRGIKGKCVLLPIPSGRGGSGSFLTSGDCYVNIKSTNFTKLPTQSEPPPPCLHLLIIFMLQLQQGLVCF